MAGRLRTWVWIVIAIVVVGILGIVALAGVGVYYFAQHIDTKPSSPAAAAHDFEQVKDRFKTQSPLLELDPRGRLLKSNTNRPAPSNPRKPDALHVLAFDPETERIVSVTIPFWLLRLKMGGTKIQLGDNNVNLEDLRLSVEDLERYGPTLIIDHKSREGERVLVWSQ
jgi:hypothetical protein